MPAGSGAATLGTARLFPRRSVASVDLPGAHRLAVERLVELLPLAEINWALMGSVAHRLQGADLECGDVDVQSGEHGSYEISARLAQAGHRVVKPVSPRLSARIQSHFGVIRFEDLGLDVEVIGAVRKLTTAGSWTAPTDPSEHRVLVPLGRLRVPVLSLAYEAASYELLGRKARAGLLRRLADKD